MKQSIKKSLVTGMLFAAAVVTLAAQQEDAVKPDKISKEELAGGIFDRPGMIEMERYGTETLDVTNLLSSDKKFGTGVYKTGKHKVDARNSYGVDELMYFIEGSITLTSADGTVTLVEEGEAVTIPKEWKGILETDGYVQIYVLYSDDGSAWE